jgi:dihydroorotate dehydrogenase
MIDLYSIMRPLLFMLGAETAHGLALRALKAGWVRGDCVADPGILKTSLWGRDFSNPIGLAAGFDKNAEVPDVVLELGFGFTEVGSITPLAQAGNPRPRLFRLPADRAVINRMGFNNDGLDVVAARLSARAGKPGAIVGINLGKNKDSDSAVEDYLKGVAGLGLLADYLVVNVSSPNTPGLRALQGKGPLRDLLMPVRAAVNKLDTPRKPPLLLKVAPDLTDEDKADIADVVMETGVDGLIATNTTIERPDSLCSATKVEGGGLSGAPLMELSTQVLSDFYRLTAGQVPLIGVGGVASGADAYSKIRAGASLVQLYSGLVYGGPTLVSRIKRDLAGLLQRDGFASVNEAVGADVEKG